MLNIISHRCIPGPTFTPSQTTFPSLNFGVLPWAYTEEHSEKESHKVCVCIHYKEGLDRHERCLFLGPLLVTGIDCFWISSLFLSHWCCGMCNSLQSIPHAFLGTNPMVFPIIIFPLSYFLQLFLTWLLLGHLCNTACKEKNYGNWWFDCRLWRWVPPHTLADTDTELMWSFPEFCALWHTQKMMMLLWLIQENGGNSKARGDCWEVLFPPHSIP